MVNRHHCRQKQKSVVYGCKILSTHCFCKVCELALCATHTHKKEKSSHLHFQELLITYSILNQVHLGKDFLN